MKKTTLLFTLIILSFFSSIQAQSTADYDISLTTIWTTAQHSSVPGSAHWSDLIGATHNTANEFVSLGANATLGIKNVAEFGSNSAFTNEINTAISGGQADQKLQQGFPFAAQVTAAFNDVAVSEDFPYVTLVSMVAPSPDWFIAVNSENLRSGNPSINNGWKNTYTIDVFAYDAGTDSGTNYTSSNNPNSAVGVSMVSGFPINGNKMGTITFTYKSSTLSVEEVNALGTIKIFPNPSQGNVTISNALSIETVEIYNILGSLVKSVKVENTPKIELDLNDLSQGMYLVKLKDISGNTKTQKLILE